MVRLAPTKHERTRGVLLGAALRRARGTRTVREVAATAGVAEETVRKIERGAVPTPALFTVAAIAQVLASRSTTSSTRSAPRAGPWTSPEPAPVGREVAEPAIPSDADLRARLRLADATLSPGLSDAELAGAERTFGVTFPPDYRRLPTLALPLGDLWPDWRGGSEAQLRDALAEPVEGILFDVEHNGFCQDWPRRFAEDAE